MNKRVINIIIILTTVSLFAALVTQLFWVKDAWHLKVDQFNNRVLISLKGIVNQLMTSSEFQPANTADFPEDFYQKHEEILTVVNPRVLDSLIKNEFASVGIEDPFQYGVYHDADTTFIMGQYMDFESNLLESIHFVSLTCLCQSENYLLSVYFPNEQSMILNELLIMPLMSGLFLLVLIFSFFFTIYIVIRQKRLSEIKTDFVNNMTHEFKTPISTISVSSEILTKDSVLKEPDKIKKYAKIIYDENNRLKNQVERVLQIAILDKDDYKLMIKELNVHELINECIENFRVQVTEKGGSLITHLNATRFNINADWDHLTNIIISLLDNANKYSPEKPEIDVFTVNENGKLNIYVDDKGIGISRENQKDIFKKFHRLQAGDIHDVKGFGIGLFYVKTMVEKMGGNIDLKSELNNGSRFILSFPV
ncbi:MAG: HAMP domain-containing histidine kinase [Bacteroidales bacterium]|nr:HAMP domain-containing histidine kinase [Bacteroidales bacterium]